MGKSNFVILLASWKMSSPRKGSEDSPKPGAGRGSRGASKNPSKSSVGSSGDGASKGSKPSR